MLRITSIEDYIINKTSIGLFEKCLMRGIKPFYKEKMNNWEAMELLPSFLSLNQGRYDRLLFKNQGHQPEGMLKEIRIPEIGLKMRYIRVINSAGFRDEYSEGVSEKIEINRVSMEKSFYVMEEINYFRSYKDDIVDISVDGIEMVKKSIHLEVKQGINEGMKEIMRGSFIIGDNLPNIKPVCVIGLEKRIRDYSWENER
jgi:hypothetical protein